MKLLKKNIIMKYMNTVFILFIVFIFAFSSLGMYFNIQMKKNLQKNVKVSLQKDSQIISSQINSYFLRYAEVVTEMQTDETLINYIKDARPTESKASDPNYKTVVGTLGKIKGTDPNINLAWLGITATNDIVTHEFNWSIDKDYQIINRPWYLEMLQNNNKIAFTTPYTDLFSGDMVISIVAPVLDNGVIIGAFGIDINMNKITSYLDSYKINNNGSILLVSNKGSVIYNKDKSISIKSDISDAKGVIGQLGNKMVSGKKGLSEYNYKNKAMYFAYTPIDSNGWSVSTIITKSETQSQINIFNIMSKLVFGISTLILIIVAFIIKISNNYSELNDLYRNLEIKDQELLASNQEISAAYQQLTASEEELRAQYEEIQNYTELITHLAYHDVLTELPNRRWFIEKFDTEIGKNSSGAVILVDIDNFKGINDTLGHVFGDKVLIKIAEELKSLEDDKLFVSRFGGDEFLILLSGEDDIFKIEEYARKIMNVFSNKLLIGKSEIHTSCSMGITLYPSDSNQVSQLLMNVDMSMYKVKSAGKNSYMFFNEEMTEKLKESISLESLLRETIETGSFKLLYQPQVDTVSGKIVGYEALVRIIDFSISPALFIPLAEEMGMIIEIGRWVTREAINQISIWKEKGLDVKPVAINFSAKQLNDPDYYDFLENLLIEKNVEAKYIDIEITESIFLEKKDMTVEFLNKLKTLGVKISLDDFGTGYSSLSYLTFLPVDKLKLDKSLNEKFLEVENIPVMKSIIALSHSLKLKVVAEGIEEIEQYNHLKLVGCDYIQGYLFSKPLEVDAVEKINDHNFLE